MTEINLNNREVDIDYTNWQGNRRWRRIRPIALVWGSYLHYHPKPQWLLLATDLDANAHTIDPVHFALKSIHGWRPADEQAPVKQLDEPSQAPADPVRD